MSEAAGSLPRRAGRRRLVPSATFGRFVARRAIALVFLAIGITLVVFLLTQLVPSDPVTANLGEQAAADPAAVAAFKEHYGLTETEARFVDAREEWFDRGHGSCALRDPQAGYILVKTLEFFNGQQYVLDAFGLEARPVADGWPRCQSITRRSVRQ